MMQTALRHSQTQETESCFSVEKTDEPWLRKFLSGDEEIICDRIPQLNKEFSAERWVSGRKRLTANEVGALKPLAGSNPALSAVNSLDRANSFAKVRKKKQLSPKRFANRILYKESQQRHPASYSHKSSFLDFFIMNRYLNPLR